MKRWLRWQGLAIFVVLVVLVSTLWFVFLDVLIKRGIEATGTKIVGAKVEVGKADLSLFPLGLTIDRLQVTDSDEPLENAVEIKRIAATIDPLLLFQNKIIINEMSVEGVQFGTPRKGSGALSWWSKKGSKEKQKSSVVPTAMLKLPDIKDILAKENLPSVALAQSLPKDISEQKQLWEKNIAALPNMEKINVYRQRVEALRSAKDLRDVGGVIGAASGAVALFNDIKGDLQLLQKAQCDMETTMKKLHGDIAKVEQAPQEESRRLAKKYGFSTEGSLNFSKLFLEPKIAAWVDKGLLWKVRLAPLVARVGEKKGDVEVVQPIRAPGLDVRFKEDMPLPDFLIRVAKVSVSLAAGEFTGEVKNITPDQGILGTPLVFTFSGQHLPGLDSLRVGGVINRVLPNASKDSLDISLLGYRMPTMTISSSASFPLKLEAPATTVNIKALSTNTGFEADVSAEMKNTSFFSEIAPNAGFDKAIHTALMGASRLSFRAKIKGQPDNYQMAISSNLDELLKNALGALVKVQIAQFEGELRKVIMAKTNVHLREAKGELGDFDGLADELQNRIARLLEIKGKEGQKLKMPFALPMPGR